MGIADGVAIAAAERVERTGGSRAGLFAWRKLAESATSAELRGTAILGAMRCALALADAGALRDLARLWPTVDQGVWDAKTSAFCKDAVRAGMIGPATELAEAEARRSGTARSIYAFARCLDVAGDVRAVQVFADAASRAEKEGAKDLARAARVRRAVWLARASETRQHALDEARAIETRELGPGERLALARILLGAPSRFVRASGLGLVDDVVSAGDALAPTALRLAARHADDMGEALTPMEVDRLLAIFSREPVAKDAERAKNALGALFALARAKDDAAFDAALEVAARASPELGPLHRRARRIVAHEPSPPSSDGTPWSSLLDAAAALAEGGNPRAALALRRLADARSLPPQAWTMAHAALLVDDPELREAAAHLVRVMLARTFAPPPRGWLALTGALATAGQGELAEATRRRAAHAEEPGATESLAISLTRAGWQLAQAGDRPRAIAKLREAKAIAARRGANR
jgi:hypothetical protein